MRLGARSPFLFALAVAFFSVTAVAEEPAETPTAGMDHATERDGKRSHLILAAIVAASFLVVGAVAGRAKGGPASRRSLRPSRRRPL